VRIRVIAIIFLGFVGVALPRTAAAQGSCHDLENLAVTGARVTSAVEVAAGGFRLAGAGPSTAAVPAFCRVIGVATPTADSRIGFEVWLPLAGWNGKFQQVGNGGFAGGIPHSGMLAPVSHGYATAGTDDGHEANGMNDTSWALGHPEKVIDYGYRAVHDVSLHAKAIIAAFYGRAPRQAYFVGCSGGGREALMEAQRYPDDFIGIAAGAPANDFTGLVFGAVWVQQALAAERGSAIPPEKLSVLQRAAVAACDALDGVKDGIITNPRACTFDPKTVQCHGANADGDGADCLTAAQVTAAAKIYSGPKNPRTGARIYPGYTPGTEALPMNWRVVLTGSDGRPPIVNEFAQAFFSNMVFANPAWNFKTFDFDRDVDATLKKIGPIVNAQNPDLTAFKARGGKLIQYHGWGDAALPPQSSIIYFESVQARMAPKNHGTGDFYRLFMAPGMAHCGGGIGATELLDPVVLALDRWVEEDVAPDQLIATGTVPDDPAKTKMARPVCPYPQVAEYKGRGDTNDAANFVCR
jgi:feruloyl esterase